eukprot:3537705-Rhodomonas_salina.1
MLAPTLPPLGGPVSIIRFVSTGHRVAEAMSDRNTLRQYRTWRSRGVGTKELGPGKDVSGAQGGGTGVGRA